jgi:flagellar motility protein MotE (MotC chaperone)
MNERIQDLTNEELQKVIDSYKTLEGNTIAEIIVKLYEKELNERTNS